jgi:hypothetical protein
VNDNPQRIRRVLKVVAVALGLLVLMGLGLQGVEWVSSKVLAKGVERVHHVVGSLRPGMKRGDVERALASAPALSRARSSSTRESGPLTSCTQSPRCATCR